VYIQPFPPSGGKWQVSSGGGSNPPWRGDGKELFYRADPLGNVMAATIHTSPSRVDIEAPHTLFMWSGPPTFDASFDGQRFLMLDPPGGASRGLVTLDAGYRQFRGWMWSYWGVRPRADVCWEVGTNPAA